VGTTQKIKRPITICKSILIGHWVEYFSTYSEDEITAMRQPSVKEMGYYAM
jgi:hypothetical protein